VRTPETDRARRFGRSPTPILLGLCLALLPNLAQAGEISAEAVKATFLYKFVPYIDWPASAFPAAATPVAVCIVGEDPFGPELERQIEAERIGPRPIVVRSYPVARPHSGCQVMYLAGSDAQSVAQGLRIVRGEPVLTVTDDAAAKGIVDFTVVEGRVRFRINEQSASENGLHVRSPLLALAISVVRDGSGR
jgi:hypothetical protein